MALENVLAGIPGLSGYLAQKQMNEQTSSGDLARASSAMGLVNAIEQNAEMGQARSVMAGGGTPDEIIKALAATGPAGALAASHYATALEHSAKMKTATRNAAFLSPENAARFTLPGSPGQPAVAAGTAPGADVGGGPPVPFDQPATAGGPPQFDAQRFAMTGAAMGVPGMEPLLNHLSQREQARASLAVTASHYAQMANDQSLNRQQREDAANMANETRLQIAADSNALRRDLKSMGQGGADKYANVTPDGKGGYVGLNKTNGRMEQVPMGEGVEGPGKYTPEALGTMAWEKLLFGTDPKGMGNLASAQRAQVSNERARIGHSLGLNDTEIAMLPQDNKIKMKAADKLTTWGVFVDKSAEQLTRTIDIAIEYAKKLDPTTLQSLNKGILAGRKEFNDPIANAYALQVNTIRQEYGRLMSGPTSNAMLPVEAMKKGDDLISMGLDVPAWNEVRAAVLRDAHISKSSVQNQINSLRSGIQNPTGAASNAQAPGQRNRTYNPSTGKFE